MKKYSATVMCHSKGEIAMNTIDDLKKYIEGYCNGCMYKNQCETTLELCTGAEMVIISFRMIAKGEY